jgi:dTDP-4-dehydrorhamnose reductase
LAKTRDRLTVVADQYGCPTAAADLATAILAVAERLDRAGWLPEYQGIFHPAGSGHASWTISPSRRSRKPPSAVGLSPIDCGTKA